MHAIYGAWIGLQARTAWTSAGLLVVALVICCLLMLFMMGRGTGGKSRNQGNTDKKSNEDEQFGIKKP